MKVKGWPGYVRHGVFVIEKRIAKKKWHVSTRATTLKAAMKQLERFEADPAHYRPDGGTGPRLVLDDAMIDEFFEYHLTKTTREWALNTRRALQDWNDHLKGRDLRQLHLVEDLKSGLQGKKSVPHRVKAIRSLFKWLRTEKGLITRQQDATLDFQVPAGKPAQWNKTKAVPWQSVVDLLPFMRADVRDALEMLATLGWHLSELTRFAESGTIRQREPAEPENVAAVIGVIHKGKKPHFTALLHEEHAELARRIRARGHLIDRGALRKQMLKALKAANAARAEKKLPPLSPVLFGSMRHSVTNWLRDAGVRVEDRGLYLGHGERTNERHYVDAQRPPIVLPKAVLRVVR